jgi:hypothetical protein
LEIIKAKEVCLRRLPNKIKTMKRLDNLCKRFLEIITGTFVTNVIFLLIFVGIGYTLGRLLVGLIFNT